MNASFQFQELYKVIIIGDTGVGKTSLLFRYVDNAVLDVTVSIGVDYKTKMVNVDNTKIKLQLWDTSGQERYRTITKNYYKGAHAIVFVFDVTNPKSLENIQNWEKEATLHGRPGGLRLLIGNKTDLTSERKVEYDIGLAMAESFDMKYFETSAKTSLESIETAFSALASQLHEKKDNFYAQDNQSNMQSQNLEAVLPPADSDKCAC
jgi:small GTP-binding protein